MKLNVFLWVCRTCKLTRHMNLELVIQIFKIDSTKLGILAFILFGLEISHSLPLPLLLVPDKWVTWNPKKMSE
jgi:hypothetical protein